MVMECVEEDADLIFLVDLLAADHVIADVGGVVVEGEEDDVEILVGIAEVRFRLLRDGLAVDGIVLPELIDLEHGVRDRRGELHVSEVFKFRFASEVGDLQSREAAQGVASYGGIALGEDVHRAQQDERRHAQKFI